MALAADKRKKLLAYEAELRAKDAPKVVTSGKENIIARKNRVAEVEANPVVSAAPEFSAVEKAVGTIPGKVASGVASVTDFLFGQSAQKVKSDFEKVKKKIAKPNWEKNI